MAVGGGVVGPNLLIEFSAVFAFVRGSHTGQFIGGIYWLGCTERGTLAGVKFHFWFVHFSCFVLTAYCFPLTALHKKSSRPDRASDTSPLDTGLPAAGSSDTRKIVPFSLPNLAQLSRGRSGPDGDCETYLIRRVSRNLLGKPAAATGELRLPICRARLAGKSGHARSLESAHGTGHLIHRAAMIVASPHLTKCPRTYHWPQKRCQTPFSLRGASKKVSDTFFVPLFRPHLFRPRIRPNCGPDHFTDILIRL